jgi:putative oxidoreductase
MGLRGSFLTSLRRLFSTFARGSPGAGLLLMRVVAGIALVVHGVTTLQGQAAIGAVLVEVSAAGAGILLLAGLWTPIAGTLVTLIELRSIFSQAGDPWIYLLLGTLGAALALLGPGGWSFDAYLFGWKRIAPRDRKS